MPNINPVFYSEGHTPVNHQSAEMILQKILGAIIDNGPAGGGGDVTIGTVNQGTGGASAWLVTAASLPLPSGASTSALQTTGNTSLSSIDGKIVTVNTGAVVVASSALPSGASTSALQTTGNTSLASIDTKLTSPITVTGTITANNASIGSNGAAIPASSTQVGGSDGTNLRPLSVDTTGKANINNISGTVSLPTGAATEATLSSLNGKVTAVNTGAVVVSSSALPTGAATETSLAKLPVAQGSTTSGESGPLVQGAVTTAAPTYTTAQTSPLSLTTGGALRVDASASTQPISGTVAATQSGTWTVQPGNTANTTAWKVDGSAVTQPVSYATTGHGTATGALRVELPTDGTGVIATVGAVTAITNALPTGTNAIGTVQIGNTPNTTPILANEKDPTATTGNITTTDSGSSSTTNSINQTIITGSATANSIVSVAITGQTAVTIQLSGTVNGVFAFERSIDGGTTWTSMSVEEVSVGTAISSITISDNKAYILRSNVAGTTNVRVRGTTVTSGTCAVNIQPTYGAAQIPVNQGIAASATNPWPFYLPSKVVVSQTFTRPSNTTAYAVNGVVGFTAGATNNSWSGCSRTSAGSGTIVKARLQCNSTTTSSANFRLYLYTTAPTAQADQATFNLLFADASKRIGFIDFTYPVTSTGSTDSIETPGALTDTRLDFVCASSSTTLYGQLIALSAYVPTSAEQFYLELTIQQD